MPTKNAKANRASLDLTTAIYITSIVLKKRVLGYDITEQYPFVLQEDGTAIAERPEYAKEPEGSKNGEAEERGLSLKNP